MSTQIITPSIRRPLAVTDTPRHTARLLNAGIVAGPLFLAVYALQALTRDGFDPGKHPISLLSLGDLGPIQIANFVVTGALCIACAVGLRRAMPAGRGSTWAPRLIAAMGAGFIVAGVFVTDAGAGYPAGAPDGKPEMSWHGALHELGYVVVVLSWTAACLVLRSHFAGRGERRMARACVGALAAVLLISAMPDADSFTARIAVATGVQFALVAAVAARLKRRAGRA